MEAGKAVLRRYYKAMTETSASRKIGDPDAGTSPNLHKLKEAEET